MAVDLGGIDPWVVQPRERARYEDQFRSLNPINGVITGDQAKGFLLQSQLPPPILGQIWALADADADGRMDINEFSIACKLINLKLKGFQIPPTLPPVLKALLTQSPLSSQPQPAINGSVVPAAPLISSQPVPTQPIMPTQPLIASQSFGAPTSTVPPLIPAIGQVPPAASMISRPSLTGDVTIPTIPQPVRAPIIPPQPAGIPVQPGYPGIPGQPIIPTSMIPQQVPGSVIPPVIPQAPVMPQVPPVLPPGMAGIVQPPAVPPMPAMVPPVIPPVPAAIPTQVPPAEVKTADKVPPIESPSAILSSPVLEWGVPHQSKLKYTQLFNTTDRTRTGFLSGPQARNIMMQTRLPQAILAQIWALSDADSDGRLSCEEFVLALHLCDMAKEGRPIPPSLPPELVPPTLRRKSRTSISLSDDNKDILSAIQNSVSFEDKRKENFDKGQAELDRRRAALLEAQRKEQEERERKEREEQEKLEKIRAEQEARRQQELQKQLQRQREIEQQQEEERRRATEQREAARKELERQRQQEWERQRTQELESQRMKEQDNVLRLKARNQALAIELATLTSKVKELSAKISETRNGVSGVKSTIDGMRTTRDTHMSEMAALKSKLKEQNQRLLALTQEKAKLEARNKATAAADAAASEQVRLAFTNKQITIKHLNEKLTDLQNEVKSKTDDFENNNTQLKDLKTQLKNLVNECETLYSTYGEKRDSILQLKAATGSGGWGAPAPSWGATDSWGATPAADAWGTTAAPSADHRKYRAIYEFSSRNPDELSFQPGDIILVPINQTAEPGWLAGELRGATGWFPESYVEPIEQEADLEIATDIVSNQGKQHLEGILEVPEGGNEIKPVGEELNEWYVSVYPYQSAEVGDLSLEQGENVLVIKKEGDWWTGVIGDRTGIFPSNYVQLAEAQPEAAPIPAAVVTPIADTTAADDDNVFMQPGEEIKQEPAKSPLPGGSTCVSGRETPADFEHTKPVTPDFSNIPAAQTKMGKKGEIATVIAPYQATSSEQLSLQRGQLVCIRKKTTTGWWEGELQAKGKKKQVGWFPASYVKIMASRRLSQTTPDIEAEQNYEKVIAMFPYKAQNEDELSFEKDDVIRLLAREEAAWWRGELRGTTGLFPSNYVMPLDNQSDVAPRIDSEEKLRQEAIQEMVESERAYTNDMAVVRQVFEKPLSRSGFVTREQMGKIFLNWREILRQNHSLLKLLDERKKQSPNGVIMCIGDILRDNLPRMSAYVRFCSCQLSAGALLQELTDSSPAFKELCRQCQRDPRTQGLPLSTFLVKPMQRITKYPLLISKVLDHTPLNHPDRPLLEEALLRAEELCSQVNEGVRETENAGRLEWLQSHIMLEGLEEPLVFNSVTNMLGPRKFLYYGVLSKVRSGREIVGFLLTDCLVLAQPLKPLVNSQFSLERNSNLTFKLYKKPLLVKDMTAQKSNESSDRAFTINIPKGQYTLLANTSGEASQWVKHITAAHQKYENPENKINISRFPKADDGPTAGRLLVEVVEGVNLGTRSALCEVRLGSQVQYTPALGPPCKWNASMQFLIREINTDVLTVALVAKYCFRPDDLLDRGEIKVSEIMQQTRSAGPVLRKLALPQLGAAEIILKLDVNLFN